MISSRKSKLELDAKKGRKSAQTALKLSRNPDRFLSTVQIGITLIGILTGLYSGEAFSADLGRVIAHIDFLAPWSVTIAKVTIVVMVTYLTLILGELVPKRIGMKMPEKISMLIAQPMQLLSYIATPFVWLLSKSTALMVRLLRLDKAEDSKVTEEEIRAMMDEGVDDGEVQEVEHDIVDRVFLLGDRNVGSIMTHRNEVVRLDISDDRETIRQKVKEHLFDTYPVVDQGLDNLLGVVSIKDLFVTLDTPDFSLQTIMCGGNFLPENQSVYSALEQFKKKKVKYGLVIDEFGDLMGIVTLKDILEALIGEVPGTEDEAEIRQREDGSWIVDGQYSFYNFLEHLQRIDLYTDYNFNTLSGLILHELGHVPSEGEKVKWMDLKLEVLDMDGARIDKVLVREITK